MYSILTPLGYHAHVSLQKLEHIEKHPLAVKHKNDIPYILNNPDLVTPNMEIRIIGGVVEFIFGPSKRIAFGYEGRPGIEVGRDSRSKKVVAYMSLDFPHIYRRLLNGLKEKPITKKFSVEVVEDYENVTPICDPRVKNATFAEIVQWVWERYYAHLEATPSGETRAAETVQA